MNKKLKIAIVAVAALLVLLIGAALVVRASFESVVKSGVAAIGPKITGSKVSLGSIKFQLMKGSLALGDFELGNPEGYSTPYALKAHAISVSLRPLSLLKPKIVINDIDVNGVDLYYEQSLAGGSNLTAIKANVDSFLNSLPGSKKEQPAKEQAQQPDAKAPGKKLQVDRLAVSDVSAHLSVKGLGGGALPVVVPPIKLENLGSGPEGITPADLGATVLDKLLDGVLKSIQNALPSLKGAADAIGKGASSAVDGASKGASNAVNSVMGIFK